MSLNIVNSIFYHLVQHIIVMEDDKCCFIATALLLDPISIHPHLSNNLTSTYYSFVNISLKDGILPR